jgi:hypothetical protein
MQETSSFCGCGTGAVGTWMIQRLLSEKSLFEQTLEKILKSQRLSIFTV